MIAIDSCWPARCTVTRAVALPEWRCTFEVFRLLGAGMSVTEIARAVNLSVKTVSTHRTRILAKTGLATNADIVAYVTRNDMR
jgi:DNA-binding NarL/FixJ family response regulator